MDNSKIIKTLFEENLRAETIVHLASMCFSDGFSLIATETFEYDSEEVWEALGLTEERNRLVEEEGDDLYNDEIEEMLSKHKKFGFLVKMATPIPTKFHGDGGYSTCGWGSYTTKWFYAEMLEEIFERAVKWKDDFIEERRTKEGVRKEQKD